MHQPTSMRPSLSSDSSYLVSIFLPLARPAASSSSSSPNGASSDFFVASLRAFLRFLSSAATQGRATVHSSTFRLNVSTLRGMIWTASWVAGWMEFQ